MGNFAWRSGNFEIFTGDQSFNILLRKFRNYSHIRKCHKFRPMRKSWIFFQVKNFKVFSREFLNFCVCLNFETVPDSRNRKTTQKSAETPHLAWIAPKWTWIVCFCDLENIFWRIFSCFHVLLCFFATNDRFIGIWFFLLDYLLLGRWRWVRT